MCITRSLWTSFRYGVPPFAERQGHTLLYGQINCSRGDVALLIPASDIAFGDDVQGVICCARAMGTRGQSFAFATLFFYEPLISMATARQLHSWSTCTLYRWKVPGNKLRTTSPPLVCLLEEEKLIGILAVVWVSSRYGPQRQSLAERDEEKKRKAMSRV